MTYRLTDTDCVIRLADGVTIPPDPENVDRAAYGIWLAEGGVPEPYVAPVPPLLRVLSVLEFRERLTPEEELAITAAGMADPSVRVWLDRLASAQVVNLDDKRTVAGLQIMEAAGLLGRGRIAEIVT